MVVVVGEREGASGMRLGRGRDSLCEIWDVAVFEVVLLHVQICGDGSFMEFGNSVAWRIRSQEHGSA
jgi:hypothetical protein